MAITKIASLEDGLNQNGGTTGSMDTTGANFIVIVVSTFNGGSAPTVSDSKGNTYTGLTQQDATTNSRVKIFYCKNATVGSGHTFTISGTNSYPGVSAVAFSGIDTTDPFDQQNGSGATTSSTTHSPGSITPTENGELIILVTGYDTSVTLSVNSSMTIEQQEPWVNGVNMGYGIAYLIQSTATAINPTWTASGNTNFATAIASFKEAPSLTATTYYFDESDATATDPDSVWTNDSNAFDGSTATIATSADAGSGTTNNLYAEGTNAPGTGGNITQVRARIYGKSTTDMGSTYLRSGIYTDGKAELLGTTPQHNSFNTSSWTDYVTLSTPTGGWTWDKIQSLEVNVYNTSGTGLTNEAARVEIEVTHENVNNTSNERTSKTTGVAGNLYTKQVKEELPATKENLEPAYTATEITNVETDDAVFTNLDFINAGYAIHQYKILNLNNTDGIVITWNGKTSLATTSQQVALQIYNNNSEAWETIDTDTTTAAGVEFTLNATINTSISNYYDENNIIAIRVYQQFT